MGCFTKSTEILPFMWHVNTTLFMFVTENADGNGTVFRCSLQRRHCFLVNILVMIKWSCIEGLV